MALISPRLTPHWEKECLYILHSRTETGYLLYDSCVFADVPQLTNKDDGLTERLLIFQRVARFAIKQWHHLALSKPAEQWLTNGECGVVFPFPKSKSTGFRVTLRRGYDVPRIKTRHGTQILFAFASGTREANPTQDQEREYKRAFGELGAVRQNVDVQLRNIEAIPEDLGYHPLILSEGPHSVIRYQSYDKWLTRLTVEQKQFVTSRASLPQRVEGPAGTGKTLCLMLARTFFVKKLRRITRSSGFYL